LKRNCLQVHDELVFDVHNDEPEKSNRWLKYEMEHASIDVPLDVDLGVGKDWLEALKLFHWKSQSS
jgi:DNA polymerase-1